MNKPKLVAEISANHNGSLKMAKKLIKTAKINGADFVKLQTYTPKTMTINSRNKYFKISKGLWKGKTLWELYDKAQTPFEWQKELFDYAKKIKIRCFSTPFDESAVDLLETLGCPIYKISSFEMNDLNLIRKVSKTGKPLIISTGLASLDEIEKTYKTARRNGAKDITLLYCVSNYPSTIDNFNMNNLKMMKKKFKCKVGLSDHSKDPMVMTAAIACGAEIIEKHIALEKQKKGFDIEFSLKGKEIREFVNNMNKSFQLFKRKNFYRDKKEMVNIQFRRSIFSIKDIKKGEKFSRENLKVIRPGYGLPPFYINKLIGKKSPESISKATPLNKRIINKIF